MVEKGKGATSRARCTGAASETAIDCVTTHMHSAATLLSRFKDLVPPPNQCVYLRQF